VTQREALEEWWASLSAARRCEVLDVAPGDLLGEALAHELQLHGVHVPDVALALDVDGDVRRIVVHVQPRVLTDFLGSAGPEAPSP
jgi:hypothetical protein